jgi:hypothetical protein
VNVISRPCVSIALPADNFDVGWVMSQAGHADSKLMMDVYAQLEGSGDRSHEGDTGTGSEPLRRYHAATAAG